jgi:uncharacterized protein
MQDSRIIEGIVLASDMTAGAFVLPTFAQASGFGPDEISISPPAVTDRRAQNSGASTVTVCTHKVDKVLDATRTLSQLGERGISLDSQNCEHRAQFLYTGLNSLKPAMMDEATKNARLSADKFARDSSSVLGKIKHTSQGQFSIEYRDASTPNIKKVRVVSTVEYYLD